MTAQTCDRCRLVETEWWRLGQRQYELERRIASLQLAVDRLHALVGAVRQELREVRALACRLA